MRYVIALDYMVDRCRLVLSSICPMMSIVLCDMMYPEKQDMIVSPIICNNTSQGSGLITWVRLLFCYYRKDPVMPRKATTTTTATKKATATKTGTVFGGTLNIRKAADINSDKVGTLEDGTKVTILEDCGEWFKIEAGYVMKKWVK